MCCPRWKVSLPGLRAMIRSGAWSLLLQMPDSQLARVLSEIQRRGAIGRGSIDEAIRHADGFVAVLPPVGVERCSLVDLGSGGGLPGLVLGLRRNDLDVVLVERRAKRADLLRFGIRALDIGDRVRVFEGDAADLRHPSDVLPEPVQVVTARSFGPPLEVLSIARRLLDPGGRCLISEPPSRTARWSEADLVARDMVDLGESDGVRSFQHHA